MTTSHNALFKFLILSKVMNIIPNNPSHTQAKDIPVLTGHHYRRQSTNRQSTNPQ
ncbi:hypothetical protein HanXRQr2_Chr17g0790391 [Helianthus annuus]|uniref:Uncharacterized protein n=1 Tax=Helianthus annuus TaxID=4232 RepID=A0A9K3DG61_HELAN|nr:hypothetical protein HanXRQr2_Chr17g0790391 [Helianthus annuus]